MADRVAYRTCPLCEATCGLEITVRDGRVARIRGDRDDVFSHGFICPKGSTLKQLHEDPDRLRAPLVKRDGRHVEVSWDEAWREVARGLSGVIERHGRGALGAYVGNPNAHNLSPLLYNRVWLRALGTRQLFSASSVDQIPKQVASGYLFGSPAAIAVPDVDRTDHLLMLGADPYESNGSLCTAPDFPGRLEALRARGGRLVVVDPRRTRTAQAADEWVAIRPGTDALLLAAMIRTLVDDGAIDPGERIGGLLSGVDEVLAALAPFTPESTAAATGVAPEVTRRLAREFAAAPTAVAYGRMGTSTVSFGTTTSWLVDVLNALTGNLDSPGGAMFPLPAAGNATTHGEPGRGKGFRTGRGHSRVSGRPEALGEYPVAVLAEEMLTPGDGRIRALVTAAGNPVLSTPNSGRLETALESLEFMVSVDIYLNETTRHADVILPPPSQLERSHFDLVFTAFSVRNVANYSEAVFARDPGQPDEWEILLRLAAIAGGAADSDVAALDELVLSSTLDGLLADPSSAIRGRDAAEIRAALGDTPGPERLLDLLLRSGAYGDGFGARPGGLTLDVLRANPHGVDLGPLEPRLPEALRTQSGKVELGAPALLADLGRLERSMSSEAAPLVLVGRRHVRSNNSWMHNVEVLVKGRERCTLLVHPDDASAHSLVDGAFAEVSSRVGALRVRVEVTSDVRPGVVSLPHGWGHDRPDARLGVAARYAGVNANVLTDEAEMDPLSGNAVLNGVPVAVRPVVA